MENKQVKQMIQGIVGDGAEWVNNWYKGSSTLIYMYQHNSRYYLYSYVTLGAISLTANQLKGE